MDGQIIVQFILQIRRSHWWVAQLAVLFYIRGFAPAWPLWHKPSKKTRGGIICQAVPEPMSGGGGVYLVKEDFVVSGRERD